MGDLHGVGGSATVGRTWFEGIKFGLFTYNLSTAAAGGIADFDYFHYTHDAPTRGTEPPGVATARLTHWTSGSQRGFEPKLRERYCKGRQVLCDERATPAYQGHRNKVCFISLLGVPPFSKDRRFEMIAALSIRSPHRNWQAYHWSWLLADAPRQDAWSRARGGAGGSGTAAAALPRALENSRCRWQPGERDDRRDVAAGGSIQPAVAQPPRAARAEQEVARRAAARQPQVARSHGRRYGVRRTSATGGETATGGVAATGGRTGGHGQWGTAGITVADAGCGRTAAAGGRTGGTTVGGDPRLPAGQCYRWEHRWIHAAGRDTSAGGTTASGGTRTAAMAEWLRTIGLPLRQLADTGDNFQNGVLQPSGLSAASDTYATVKTKSDAILSGFQTLLDANTYASRSTNRRL